MFEFQSTVDDQQWMYQPKEFCMFSTSCPLGFDLVERQNNSLSQVSIYTLTPFYEHSKELQGLNHLELRGIV